MLWVRQSPVAVGCAGLVGPPVATAHCTKGKEARVRGRGTRKHSGAQDFFLIYRIFSNSGHIWRDPHTVMKNSLFLDIWLNFPWCSVVGHTIAIRLMHPWDSSLAHNKYQKNTTLCHTNHHKKDDQNTTFYPFSFSKTFLSSVRLSF